MGPPDELARKGLSLQRRDPPPLSISTLRRYVRAEFLEQMRTRWENIPAARKGQSYQGAWRQKLLGGLIMKPVTLFDSFPGLLRAVRATPAFNTSRILVHHDLLFAHLHRPALLAAPCL
ncbi:Protein of unknown function [Pyronema omphalodes CBS 100304]|uniref:Uncharacterized protein n=1 Tax=Pyronema omphalodes (strain CBS 100304) TaxID=1076935 RepID=U4LHJ5_PYROM|nr:Protein of unknown function [Pyronema omphalodes CBS 100304]